MGPKKQAETKEDDNVILPKNDNVIHPKRPCTSYIYFNTETAKKIREKNSELSQPEVFKKVAEVWKALTEK